MATITSIKPQKSKKDRLNIFLDGKFAFSLSADILAKAALCENQEISGEKVAELIKESEFSLVFDKVLRFLSFRPRSEFEINEYMLRKEVGGETREMVLEKLKNLNLIDDEAFARQWIEFRTHGRPEGKTLIKMELRRKGVDKEIIDKLLSEERGSASEKILAEKYGRAKLKRFKNLPALEAKRKLYSALMMRGFSGETVREVIDKLLKKE